MRYCVMFLVCCVVRVCCSVSGLAVVVFRWCIVVRCLSCFFCLLFVVFCSLWIVRCVSCLICFVLFVACGLLHSRCLLLRALLLVVGCFFCLWFDNRCWPLVVWLRLLVSRMLCVICWLLLVVC